MIRLSALTATDRMKFSTGGAKNPWDQNPLTVKLKIISTCYTSNSPGHESFVFITSSERFAQTGQRIVCHEVWMANVKLKEEFDILRNTLIHFFAEIDEKISTALMSAR